jgi:hypothetical protein
MAKFRMTADEPRQVSMLPSGTLRLIGLDEVFEVPDEVADSYEGQPFYERIDAAKKSTAKKGDD